MQLLLIVIILHVSMYLFCSVVLILCPLVHYFVQYFLFANYFNYIIFYIIIRMITTMALLFVVNKKIKI